MSLEMIAFVRYATRFRLMIQMSLPASYSGSRRDQAQKLQDTFATLRVSKGRHREGAPFGGATQPRGTLWAQDAIALPN